MTQLDDLATQQRGWGASTPNQGGRPGMAFSDRRVLARALDTIILFGPALLAQAFTGWVFLSFEFIVWFFGGDVSFPDLETWRSGLFWGGIFFAEWAIFLVLAERLFGGSLGKLATDVRVVGPGGGKPTLRQSFVRNLPFAPYFLIPAIGVVALPVFFIVVLLTLSSISSSPLKQGFHDRWAGGTRVVAGPPRKARKIKDPVTWARGVLLAPVIGLFAWVAILSALGTLGVFGDGSDALHTLPPGPAREQYLDDLDAVATLIEQNAPSRRIEQLTMNCDRLDVLEHDSWRVEPGLLPSTKWLITEANMKCYFQPRLAARALSRAIEQERTGKEFRAGD